MFEGDFPEMLVGRELGEEGEETFVDEGEFGEGVGGAVEDAVEFGEVGGEEVGEVGGEDLVLLFLEESGVEGVLGVLEGERGGLGY